MCRTWPQRAAEKYAARGPGSLALIQIRDAVIHNMSLFDEYPEGLCTSPCFLENAAGTF